MRGLMKLGLVLLVLVGCAGKPGTGEEQALVDRAALTVQEILGNDPMNSQSMLRRARAAMICPRSFRAGFLFGYQGGDCVLVARDAAGSWSSPAFYSTGTGSFGLQAGVQDMEVLLLIMNDKALNAVLDSQIKAGADASIAVATVGGALSGATTAAVGADIVAFARTRGLYAGLTVDLSHLSALSAWNRGYYGRDVGPRDIVVAMAAHNPGADPLRAVLMRYGSGTGPAAAPALPPPVGGAGGGAMQPMSAAPAGGGVQSAPLPPVR
jgi:lipid-binding SYLF domain-containing protein